MDARDTLEEALRLHNESLRLHEESLRLHSQSLQLQREALRLQRTIETEIAVEDETLEDVQDTPDLCQDCKRVPFRMILDRNMTPKPRRRKIGTLSKARSNQDHCRFCRFIVQSCSLVLDSRQNAVDDRQIDKLYFVNNDASTPWHEVAGIASDLSPGPFAWLQLRVATGSYEPIEPYICISAIPFISSQHDIAVDHPPLLPRQRNLEEMTTGRLNIDLIKSWLRICQEQHDDVCGTKMAVPRSGTRLYLIDVHTNTISVIEGNPRYLALSYVSGRRTEELHHVPVEGSVLSRPQSFDPHLPPYIPRTIQDALTFTKMLGEQYLWVDTYCIDPVEQQAQIDNMDRVYQEAYLVLIVADGENVEAGIPGISVSLEKVYQPIVETEHRVFMATYVHSTWDHNGMAAHDLRGWTMQERLLARRRLIFSQNHIMLKCWLDYFHDTLTLDTTSSRVPTEQSGKYFWDNGDGIDIYGERWTFRVWDALVSIYSGRSLSFETDALNACRGALNQITRGTGVHFTYGMPKQDLLRALLWKPHHEHCLSRRDIFPSWSWSGWKGRSECHHFIGDMDLYGGSDTPDASNNTAIRRRRRIFQDLEGRGHTRSATILEMPHSDSGTNLALRISSFIGVFDVSLVRERGSRLRHLRSDSLQVPEAVGDQWTILNPHGTPLRDLVGQFPSYFESTDYFFQVNRDISMTLSPAGAKVVKAEFLFISYWPEIRDSEENNEMLKDMVSALLILRNDDGSAWRVASVVMKIEEWLASNPQAAEITLM